MLLNIPIYDEKMIESMAFDSITADEINTSLENYQSIYKDCLMNNSQRNYFNTFMRGLLSNLERKTIEPIAVAFMEERIRNC